MIEWLRKVTPSTDVTMSVCTGAFKLAKAGLLSGKAATTHHDFIDKLQKEYPDIDVKGGVRFVEGEKISTAGGLTSGTDLALRVVERYFGREVRRRTSTPATARPRRSARSSRTGSSRQFNLGHSAARGWLGCGVKSFVEMIQINRLCENCDRTARAHVLQR